VKADLESALQHAKHGAATPEERELIRRLWAAYGAHEREKKARE
jgi:hypothetical protein